MCIIISWSGVTAVLTLSAISMDSRSDLPKVQYATMLYCTVLCCSVVYCTVLQVQYATALDWFIICSFLYCVATILEFAGVHYFTKVRGILSI